MRTVTLKLEITSCSKCPYFKEGDHQSTDGFDAGYDWFCMKKKRKKIAGFVEWHEVNKIEIPNWCPLAEDNSNGKVIQASSHNNVFEPSKS